MTTEATAAADAPTEPVTELVMTVRWVGLDPDAVRAARKQAGLTQYDLSLRLGLPQTKVSRWERGDPLSPADAMALAEALGLAHRIAA
jgi:DNA-binding transcriptional regulator YiaG